MFCLFVVVRRERGGKETKLTGSQTCSARSPSGCACMGDDATSAFEVSKGRKRKFVPTALGCDIFSVPFIIEKKTFIFRNIDVLSVLMYSGSERSSSETRNRK